MPQTMSKSREYATFLQETTPPEHRDDLGLEGVLREVFPIPSYDGTMAPRKERVSGTEDVKEMCK